MVSSIYWSSKTIVLIGSKYRHLIQPFTYILIAQNTYHLAIYAVLYCTLTFHYDVIRATPPGGVAQWTDERTGTTSPCNEVQPMQAIAQKGARARGLAWIDGPRARGRGDATLTLGWHQPRFNFFLRQVCA